MLIPSEKFLSLISNCPEEIIVKFNSNSLKILEYTIHLDGNYYTCILSEIEGKLNLGQYVVITRKFK